MPSGKCPVQKNTRVELDTGFGRRHRQRPAPRRVAHKSGLPHYPLLSIENLVMVISSRQSYLLIAAGDALADCVLAAEIERRAFHSADFARRDQCLIDRRKGLRMQRHRIDRKPWSTGN
jgi:hypothetical protein